MAGWRVGAAVLAIILLAGAPAASVHAQNPPRKSFRTIATRFYTLSTDVSEELAREAGIRADRMFEEYTERTSGFARPPQRKMLLRLYAKAADYHADGGPAGSLGGVKFGRNSAGALTAELMVVDERREVEDTWHVLQHEGFHQFAKFAISPRLPVWVDEGLADYYAIARFVGDGFVYGRIPEHRRERARRMIKANEHQPFAKFTTFTYQQWMADLSPRHYLQAWSMVHFLTEGEEGKHQKSFNAYVAALARGTEGQQAWNQAFGRETQALEDAWKKYWTGMPADSKATLERQIRLMTLASFLAHAAKAGKKYEQFPTFFTDAKKGAVKLPLDPAVWLPPTLLEQALGSVDPARVTLTWNAGTPKLVETQPEGGTILITYTGRRVMSTTQPAK